MRASAAWGARCSHAPLAPTWVAWRSKAPSMRHARHQRDLTLPPAALPGGREDELLVAFHACQGRSLFAAQCFVEAALDAHSAGETPEAAQAALALRNAAQGGSLLEPMELDLLLSWVGVVMLTAREAGIESSHDSTAGTTSCAADAPPSSAEQVTAGEQQQQQQQDAAMAAQVPRSSTVAALQGLLGFVKQSERLYFEEGYTVSRLTGLQAAVAADQQQQGGSAALAMMQQYSLLVLVTLEVAAAAGLKSVRPLTNPVGLSAPTGYTAAGLTAAQCSPGAGAAGLLTEVALTRGLGGTRARAVRLLVAFIGAARGCAYSGRAFLLSALEAYEAGEAVPELLAALQPAEFEQSGGLVPAAPPPGGGGPGAVNQALFGRALSTVYMAAAQLNAVFPGASNKPPGWAWYGGEDEVAANALAAFVAQTLQHVQQQQGYVADADGTTTAGGDDVAPEPTDPLAARIRSLPDAAAGLAEASAALQKEYQSHGTLRGRPLPVLVRMPDPELGATSSALRVWQQQVELVQGVFAYMCALQGV